MGSRRAGFTYIEVVAAIAILGLISGSVLVVLNRSIEAMIDSRVRMQTFELVRRNMEELLASVSVTDTAKFGTHELNDDIEWETIIEPFNEPVKSKMWIRAICSASFTDRYGERQRIELIHWLTQVTGAQERLIRDQWKREQDALDLGEGNPFGNEPDGLMRYAQSLVSMGDYAKAVEALARIPLQYPESTLIGLAFKKIPPVIEALAMTDPVAANDIVPQLVGMFPDEPTIQMLPAQLPEWTSDSYMPDYTDPETNVMPGDEDETPPDQMHEIPPELQNLLEQEG